MRKLLLSGLVFPLLVHAALDPQDSYAPRNSQKSGDEPPPAAEVCAGWKVPEGFKVTLFASEPNVRQPIDMKFDERGRVWVCEGYSYKEWQHKGEDRILIFEDKDNDGVAESRKIFRSGFHHLTSVEIGLGGVWALDVPNLYFIPDSNGDDVPDGDPVVVLDGWTKDAAHNQVNGLTWGPDGWLYGRHGITSPSLVGKPGTPNEARTFVEPGIWRVHPQTHEFQIIVKGTTNPWGLDWDENGEMFMSGNTNGHLWHVIPGSLFERMFGSGSVPHDYERLKMIGEAPHYATSGNWKEDWHKPDKGRDSQNNLGGGHSHSGLMIYQGNNWPAEYSGAFFMCNTHGRRINQERVSRDGCTYISRHIGDIASASTAWFRGVSVISGPNGGVLVSDWCDNGECHDDDGVHRTSGRIYKITHGEVKKESSPDLRQWSTEQLVSTINSDNIWHYRTARRILQERSLVTKEKAPLFGLDKLTVGTDPQRLRALWMLASCGAASESELTSLLTDKSEYLRLWSARLLTDCSPASALAREKIISLAGSEKSGLVLAHLCGLVPRWPAEDGWKLMQELLKSPSSDRKLSLLKWYAFEPFTGRRPADCLGLAGLNENPVLLRFLARRLGYSINEESFCHVANSLLESTSFPSFSRENIPVILDGLKTGMFSKTPHHLLPAWAARRDALLRDFPNETTALGLALGDQQMLETLRARFNDTKEEAPTRAAALTGLQQARVADLQELAAKAFADPRLRTAAIRAFLEAKDDAPKDKILTSWSELSPEQKIAAVEILATRRSWALALLQSLAEGKLARSDIPISIARQMSFLRDAAVDESLAKNWGKISSTSDEMQGQIARYRKLLDGAKGKPAAGRLVFEKTCASCHKLFGKGGSLGPDLTGSGRKEPGYILLNVLDPNAAVQRDFQLVAATLKDGQVLTGTAPREDEASITLQTITGEQRVLQKSDCQKVERHPFSIMPEGLLQSLSEQEFRDLMAYLGSDG